MKNQTNITTLFLDIGGVLLTNGWGRNSRMLAAKEFNLDYEEMGERHHLTYDTYELGKITLDEYLDRLVFYEKRSFTKNQFREFMFSRSQPFPEMIDLISNLKKKYNLKVAVVSNEGRELNEYRIKKFKLGDFVDFFISSSFVHFRKPDTDIFHIALDISQVSPEEVVYIDDRMMFVEIAGKMGIHGLRHVDYQTTLTKLASFGLKI